MDNRAEVREFLSTRRARLTPELAGVPVYGAGKRRVPGLRREEVALLAGVSVDYYARLEKGNLGGVSESVLDAIARALQLNEAEREHLYDLARAAQAPASRPRRRAAQVRPSILRILDALTTAVAVVRSRRLDVLAANRLGRAMYSSMFDNPANGANLARFTFLDPRATDFFPDWDLSANNTVALLRTEAGRDPHDRALTDLVRELVTRSDVFRTLWAAHNVRLHRTGIKQFHHPVVGDLELSFEALALPADPGLTLTIYTAAAGSPTEDALSLLGSWSTTIDEPAQQSRT
ncbi:helix-turn-helix transcriptional regulator [Tenggerimyces flavus]|uniref:Helix-turn-helix transcriptional regulator n=1 Tax=Tenggerimyces flavus TaxID=1708749 RepID=A0ABV7YLL2_9ACTN|nr:helix-turn-helix transcriptional regulator [Tenggerimyces flavus]MBM7789497.1 transcriptional regulator with XRE-family HTH domain [Tenggerimyces flavus]